MYLRYLTTGRFIVVPFLMITKNSKFFQQLFNIGNKKIRSVSKMDTLVLRLSEKEATYALVRRDKHQWQLHDADRIIKMQGEQESAWLGRVKKALRAVKGNAHVCLQLDFDDYMLRQESSPDLTDRREKAAALRWKLKDNQSLDPMLHLTDVLGMGEGNGKLVNQLMLVTAPMQRVAARVHQIQELDLHIDSVDIIEQSLARLTHRREPNSEVVATIHINQQECLICVYENGLLISTRRIPIEQFGSSDVDERGVSKRAVGEIGRSLDRVVRQYQVNLSLLLLDAGTSTAAYIDDIQNDLGITIACEPLSKQFPDIPAKYLDFVHLMGSAMPAQHMDYLVFMDEQLHPKKVVFHFEQMVIAMAVCALGIGGFAGWTLWVESQERHAHAQLRLEHEAKLRELDASLLKMKKPAPIDFAKLEKDVQDLQAIQKIIRERLGDKAVSYPGWLELLSRSTPENIWLTEIKGSPTGFQIEGYAVQQEAIAAWVDVLNKSEQHQGLKFEAFDVTVKEINTQKVHFFKISTMVKQ